MTRFPQHTRRSAPQRLEIAGEISAQNGPSLCLAFGAIQFSGGASGAGLDFSRFRSRCAIGWARAGLAFLGFHGSARRGSPIRGRVQTSFRRGGADGDAGEAEAALINSMMSVQIAAIISCCTFQSAGSCLLLNHSEVNAGGCVPAEMCSRRSGARKARPIICLIRLVVVCS